ncbi:MAG: VOC family protein [Bryobacteraceae bacterium]
MSGCDYLSGRRISGRRNGWHCAFWFPAVSAVDIGDAVSEAERAGGKLLRRGEFGPGYPYAYVADPDGYEVEIWYE